jgi:membrane protease YdiL (CAAX protease family)
MTTSRTLDTGRPVDDRGRSNPRTSPTERHMQPVQWLFTLVRRGPLWTFFLITFAVAWGFIPFGSFGAFSPLVAAVIVIPITQGMTGLRRLGSRLIRWRMSWHWYAVAIGVPLAVFVIAVPLTVALGAPAPSLGQLAPWYAVVTVFALRLVNPMDGPIGEEPGFRGFAQPSLQASRSPLAATAILGAVVSLWHLPLVLMPQFDLPPLGLLTTFAITFWYAWLFNRTGGSVLLTVLAHATQGIVHPTTFWGDATFGNREFMLECALWCSLAVGLVLCDWKFWHRRPDTDVTAQPAQSQRAELVDRSPSGHTAGQA